MEGNSLMYANFVKKMKNIIILNLMLISILNASYTLKEKFLVRIAAPTREMMRELSLMPFDFASMKIIDQADAILTLEEIRRLEEKGYRIEILQAESEIKAIFISPLYHTYEETINYINFLATKYPSIMNVIKIGESTQFDLPIYAVKISDNAHLEEDEPTILYDGMHHAREPLGNEICLSLMDYLLNNYAFSPDVTYWVDETEIWIIPILNPEGWKYIVDSNLSSPWWRKDLRDNNGNGIFDPDYDGVDLNRNYDFNWSIGGDTYPGSWTYKGPHPFSEKECQAKRELAISQKFVFSVSYHSYGEGVFFPWSWPNTKTKAPDDISLRNIAHEIASRIPTKDGNGNYYIGRCGGSHLSTPWIYGEIGTFEFLIETATSFIPPTHEISGIVKANLFGALYLLERIRGPGLTGQIYDLRGKPLEAVVSVLDIDNFKYISPRKSDPVFGRYYRILEHGKYFVSISHSWCETEIFHIDILPGKMTNLDVWLRPRIRYPSLQEFRFNFKFLFPFVWIRANFFYWK